MGGRETEDRARAGKRGPGGGDEGEEGWKGPCAGGGGRGVERGRRPEQTRRSWDWERLREQPRPEEMLRLGAE